MNVERLRGQGAAELAERREWHELEAEKRAARGVAAAIMKDLEFKKDALGNAGESGAWWDEDAVMELDLPRDEQVALASWIGDPAWGLIIGPFLMLIEADRLRARAATTGQAYEASRFQPIRDAIDIAVGVLRTELEGSLHAVAQAPSRESGGDLVA